MSVFGTKKPGGFGRGRKRLGLWIGNNLLLVLLIIGVAVGLLIGVLVNPPVNRISDPEKKATAVMLMGFPGELLMNMLRMLVLPLVMGSLITACIRPESCRSRENWAPHSYLLSVNHGTSGAFGLAIGGNNSTWKKR